MGDCSSGSSSSLINSFQKDAMLSRWAACDLSAARATFTDAFLATSLLYVALSPFFASKPCPWRIVKQNFKLAI